ncbi:hypothetical protein AW168_14710 [Nocardia brasiliensis]|nr:hypothetical protein AW168_14710 [Nocardia brasiliensis]
MPSLKVIVVAFCVVGRAGAALFAALCFSIAERFSEGWRSGGGWASLLSCRDSRLRRMRFDS